MQGHLYQIKPNVKSLNTRNILNNVSEHVTVTKVSYRESLSIFKELQMKVNGIIDQNWIYNIFYHL